MRKRVARQQTPGCPATSPRPASQWAGVSRPAGERDRRGRPASRLCGMVPASWFPLMALAVRVGACLTAAWTLSTVEVNEARRGPRCDQDGTGTRRCSARHLVPMPDCGRSMMESVTVSLSEGLFVVRGSLCARSGGCRRDDLDLVDAVPGHVDHFDTAT